MVRRARAEFSSGVDIGYQGSALLQSLNVANPGFAPGAQDGRVDVNGSGIAYGTKLGLTFDPTASFHMGLGYQSEVRETVKGTAVFSVPGSVPPLVGSLLAQGGVAASAGLALTNGATNTPVSALIIFPSTLSLGMTWDMTGAVTLAAEIAQTRWSTFKELRIKFADPATQPDAVTTENWKNSMFYALGATWHPGKVWTYRAGLALDTTPVPNATRTPMIPDSDRTWVSFGASYQINKAWSLDAGYSHLFCRNATVGLQGGSNPLAQTQFYGGNLSGTYKNSIDVLAVAARCRF